MVSLPLTPRPDPPAMTHASREHSLLEELELRQNEVLDQLEDLERRVESLLNEFVQARGETTAE